MIITQPVQPVAGLMAFHESRPVELLLRISEADDQEVWLVRPLFVDGEPNRTEVIHNGDRLTPIHTRSH